MSTPGNRLVTTASNSLAETYGEQMANTVKVVATLEPIVTVHVPPRPGVRGKLA